MMDRISSLPDEIVCHILSFRPIKEAALTCVLSKRWRNLFALRSDLHVRHVDFDYWNPKSNRSFTDFVDRVLAVSGNTTIRKFSMKFRQSVESAHINRWMINVLSRGIVDLDLDKLTKDVITLPLEIFTCKTIVKLKLGSLFGIDMVPEYASLPALKTLFLCCIEFSRGAFEALLSACPVLEDLTLLGYPWDWKQCQTVSCPTLERLTLSCESCKDYKFSRRLTFDTPRLTYLVYRDLVADEYPIVNLDSLVEAEVSLDLWKPHSKGNPVNLIKGLRNVEILNLSSPETSMIFDSFAESIPMFKNLSRLSVATDEFHYACWRFLPLLLEKSPNLETLVIKGPSYFSAEESESDLICECLSEYSLLSWCPVKVVEITEYRGTKGELEQMKHFLEKLPCLELVIVRASAKAKLPFTIDMPMLPGACKNVQLKFFP